MNKLLRFNDYNYIHFLTTKTYNNIKLFNNENNCLILINIFINLREKFKFKLLGYCIMPDHLHCLILNKINSRYNISFIMMMIKGTSARAINLANRAGAKPPASRYPQSNRYAQNSHNRLGEGMINQERLGEGSASPSTHCFWQKSFYDFPIYSDKKFQEKLNYLHNNPLKAGLVTDPKDYPWSSYQNYFLENNKLISIDYL